MTKPIATKDPLKNKTAFRSRIAEWFESQGHDYPWRRTRDPYAVLVSEIMLQQTQVATVLNRNYFTNWLERFPDVATLASAEEDDILHAWEGLGYYRRARNLQAAARFVIEEFSGEFPTSLEDISRLPGVGRYTAGAVASFACDLPAPIVDANVARVYSRLFDFQTDVTSTPGTKQLWAWSEALVPGENSRAFNSGLMELGQQVCGPRQVDCERCPVSAFCRTRDPLSLPRKKPRAKTVYLDEHALWVRRKGRILLEREEGPRRKGLWKLPNRDGDGVSDLAVILRQTYGITHHRVSLIIHEWPDDGRPEPEICQRERWFDADETGSVAMQSPHRRALKQLMAEPLQSQLGI